MNTDRSQGHYSEDLVGTLDIMHASAGRHPAVRGLARWLNPNPNLTGPAAQVAILCERLGSRMLAVCKEDTPELTAGLRKLLEAKDCFVRASLDEEDQAQQREVDDVVARVMAGGQDRDIEPPRGEQAGDLTYAQDSVVLPAPGETIERNPRAYADDPVLREIYRNLPADDCGELVRTAHLPLDGPQDIMHCKLLDGHSGGHELRPL